MTSITLPVANTTTTGILMMLGFAATGPAIDAFAKLASSDVPAGLTGFARFAVQLALLAPVTLALGRLRLPGPRDAALHLLRGAMLASATVFFFAALAYMPLADTIAIFFVEPFLLILLSGLFLGEGLGWRRLLACLVGFGGAMLVVQPSFAEVGWPAAYPLGTACLFAVYLVLTRNMAQRLDPFDLQCWTALAGSLVLGAVLWQFEGSGHRAFDPHWPSGLAPLWLLGVGVAALVSHMFITYAFRYAPASVLAPLQYLEIVSATLLGLAIWGDFPDALTGLGIAIVIGSGLFVAWNEGQRARAGEGAEA